MPIVRLAGLLLIGLAAVTGGCGMARVTEELLPGCQATVVKPDVSVEVYEEGVSSSHRAAIPFVRLVAHGNGYASKDVLVTALRKRTAELGGDMVVYGVPQTVNGPTVVSYGNGTAIADTIKYPTLQATGYRWSPAMLGFRWNQSLVLTDVIPGTPAAEGGVKIGERLLAVNGQRVTDDYARLARTLSELRVGQAVTLEFARPDNSVHTVSVTAAENR